MAVKPTLVPSAASENNVTKGRANTKEDVSGRSDVQTMSRSGSSTREVTTLNDLVNALNEVNSTASTHGDDVIKVGGKKITGVTFTDTSVELTTSK